MTYVITLLTTLFLALTGYARAKNNDRLLSLSILKKADVFLQSLETLDYKISYSNYNATLNDTIKTVGNCILKFNGNDFKNIMFNVNYKLETSNKGLLYTGQYKFNGKESYETITDVNNLKVATLEGGDVKKKVMIDNTNKAAYIPTIFTDQSYFMSIYNEFKKDINVEEVDLDGTICYKLSINLEEYEAKKDIQFVNYIRKSDYYPISAFESYTSDGIAYYTSWVLQYNNVNKSIDNDIFR